MKIFFWCINDFLVRC